MSPFARTMIECTVTMSAVALVLLLISPLVTKRYSAKCLYVAWLIVLAGFLVPVRLKPAPPAVVFKMPAAAAHQPIAAAATPAPAPATAASEPANAAGTEILPLPPAEQEPARPFGRFTLRADQAVVMLWALGAVVMLLFQLRRHFRFSRAVRRWSKPIAEPAYESVLFSTLDELHIRKRVGLRACRLVDSPMLVGLFRPLILLPDMPMSLSELHLILRHELIHFRRFDLWGKALYLAASALHWFNPLMPLIGKAMCFQCEASCDAEVMRNSDFETRRYYSETIIHMIRQKAHVSTALSTRYYGGKDSMKKRILRILDEKRRRLGVLVMLGSFALVLCAGMTFALGTESTPPDTRYVTDTISYFSLWNQDSVGADTYVKLNEKFKEILAQYRDELIGDYPDIDRLEIARVYNFGSYDVQEEYLLQVDSADSLREYLESGFVISGVRSEEVERAAREMLQAASYDDQSALSYTMAPGWSTPSTLTYNALWEVFAYGAAEPATAALPVVRLYIDGDLRHVLRVDTNFSGEARFAGDTNARQRALVKASATSFCQKYAIWENEETEHILVSDYVFEADGIGPFTLVWLFDHSLAEEIGETISAYNDKTHQLNYGFQLIVGVETGKILVFNPEIMETSFANLAYAQTDWVAQTGLPYPHIDNAYLMEIASPKLENLVHSLAEQYKALLTDEEAIIAIHLASSLYSILQADSDWECFSADLEACASLEDFRAVLHGDYLQINQLPEGGLRRDDYLQLARKALAGIGRPEYVNVSFVPLPNVTGKDSKNGFDIFASPGRGWEDDTLRFTLTDEGKVFNLYHSGYESNNSYDQKTAQDKPYALSESEKASMKETALRLVRDWIAVANVDEAGIRCADSAAYTFRGDPLVTVTVPYTQPMFSADDEPVDARLLLQMTLCLKSGLLEECYYTGVDEEGA